MTSVLLNFTILFVLQIIHSSQTKDSHSYEVKNSFTKINLKVSSEWLTIFCEL